MIPLPVPLFSRRWRVVVNTIETAELRVSFKIERSLSHVPNTCELQIWNLSRSSRQTLEALKGVPVSVEAGYAAATSMLYLGELRSATTTREQADLITFVGSGDGEKAYQKSRVGISVAKNSTTNDVLKKIAAALGVSKGNLETAAVSLRLAGVGSLFSQGTVLTGSAAQEMTAICRSCGLTWSIQNGALSLLPLGKALELSAIKLSAATGLVDSPTVDGKGKLVAKMLLAPDVIPGRLVVLEAEHKKGNFRIEKVISEGDTHGEPWYHTIEGKAF